MRKGIKIICMLVLIVLLFIFLSKCSDSSLMYGNKTVTADNLQFETHSIFKRCFAGAYTWSTDGNRAVLTIPDTCNGYRVTGLGGFVGSGVPSPFMVILPDVEYFCSEATLPDEAQIEQYFLEINIGKYIKNDKLIDMDCYYCMGANRFVQILVTVNCSSENPVFYSQDGKLYKRSDNSLVDGFFYYSDYLAG